MCALKFLFTHILNNRTRKTFNSCNGSCCNLFGCSLVPFVLVAAVTLHLKCSLEDKVLFL